MAEPHSPDCISSFGPSVDRPLPLARHENPLHPARQFQFTAHGLQRAGHLLWAAEAFKSHLRIDTRAPGDVSRGTHAWRIIPGRQKPGVVAAGITFGEAPIPTDKHGIVERVYLAPAIVGRDKSGRQRAEIGRINRHFFRIVGGVSRR